MRTLAGKSKADENATSPGFVLEEIQVRYTDHWSKK
jgi:hypothetical protein